tara:strand:- start:10 stop:393 length:384 start_codon:yes stop_codon:yes gene_type:complete
MKNNSSNCSKARDIQINWTGYLGISFTVTFYDDTVKNFGFTQRSPGYTCYDLYDADRVNSVSGEYDGRDDPIESFTVTHRTEPENVIAKCLAILWEKYFTDEETLEKQLFSRKHLFYEPKLYKKSDS